MKEGTCPKCDSRDVYAGSSIRVKQGVYGSNTIPLGGVFGRQIPLDNYVCGQCGYLESYVGNPKDLETLRARWERVQG